MAPDAETLLDRQQAFGYTQEDIKFLLTPMALTGQEAIGSMGADNPPSVLSSSSKLLYDLFQAELRPGHQPADRPDPRRAGHVAGVVHRPAAEPARPRGRPGSKRLEVQPAGPDQRATWSASATSGQLRRRLPHQDAATSPTRPRGRRRHGAGAGAALRRGREAVLAAQHLILSDRRSTRTIAIPALLATSAVHHHLIRKGLRTSSVGLVVETGEAREVHHFATLAGYGAEAINPYLAFDTIDMLPRRIGRRKSTFERPSRATSRRRQGPPQGHVQDGHQHLPVLLRRADLRRGRPVERVRRRYFTGTASMVEGIGLAEVAARPCAGTSRGFGNDPVLRKHLDVGGDYAYRCAARTTSGRRRPSPSCSTRCAPTMRRTYAKYSRLVNEQNERC
jgi:glutamate synthase (NADPH/NADH) large chain